MGLRQHGVVVEEAKRDQTLHTSSELGGFAPFVISICRPPT